MAARQPVIERVEQRLGNRRDGILSGQLDLGAVGLCFEVVDIKALNTPAHIYYKYEGVSPTGSHKPNPAVPQAYYNKLEGTKAMTTETGAGQWGSSLAFACSNFDIDLEIYMVKISYNQKPYRRMMMETYGAQVFASPSEQTQYGRKLLSEDPDNPGSLGIAISEAVEAAAASGGTKKYGIGSVLNHVLLHQTVIGEEA